MLPRIPVEIENAVRHEFGHLVAAKVLGFETGLVALDDGKAGAEITLDPRFKGTDELIDWVKRRVQVLYAGACAQSLKSGEVDTTQIDPLLATTAINDAAKIREVTRVICGLLLADVEGSNYGLQMKEMGENLKRQAILIVETHATLITDLTALFITKLTAATRRSGGQLPQDFTLAAKDIDQFPSVISLRKK
jgi:hypothetical protein